MPIPNHAIRTVAIEITGLDIDEATTVLHNLPVGARATVTVHKPNNTKRWAITADDLTLQGAKDLTISLYMHDASTATDEVTGGTRGSL